MSTQIHDDISVATVERTKVKKPSNYNVIFFDDDNTPMDFVVLVLMQLYHHTHDDAHAIMLNIHNTGSGVAGTYSYEVATQKRDETIIIARAHGYPLLVEIDEA